MEKQDVKLTKKNKALLSWILCEVGVENYTFDKNQCVKLYNDYTRLKRECNNLKENPQ
jgi:hypothetical protein